MDLFLIFLSGLTLGGMTCSIIQIGLFSSLFARDGGMVLRMTGVYLLTRVLIGASIGFLLGVLGSTLIFSQSVNYSIQFIAGMIMLLTALSFIPFFYRHGLTLEIFDLTKLSGVFQKFSGDSSFWAPLFFGVISFFIPCGATLAVEAQALTTGSPLYSMLLMSIFVVGTIPAFLGLSYINRIFSYRYRRVFNLILGFFLFILGTLTINGVLVLIDSPVTLEKAYAYSPIYLDSSDNLALSGEVVGDERVVEMVITNDGYQPNKVVVGEGEKVKLRLQTRDVYNCSSVFKIPALGVSKNLPVNGVTEISFIAGAEKVLYFSCSTGLKTGTITII